MITYELKHSLYLNITNRCTNSCVFCIRKNEQGVGFDLWLDKEPSLEEIIHAIDKASKYPEYVFCGYGEPLLRLPEVLETAKHLKKLGKRVRINTNGQADLIYNKPVAPQLAGLVDAISISMNASDEKSYQKLCKCRFVSGVYNTILAFARDCIRYIPEVTLTVVDIIPAEEIRKCRLIANEIGARFRVRQFQK